MVAAAEWFFWDEFSSRFNFIAVDYLVYTTEVIGNMVVLAILCTVVFKVGLGMNIYILRGVW